LADLLLETVPELIIKFVVISLSKDYTYLNIISLILSITGLIISIFYITSEWVIPEKKEEAGDGKEPEGEHAQKANGSVDKDKPDYKVIQNMQHKNDYEKPEKEIENNGYSKIEVREIMVEEANGIFSNQENAPIVKSQEEMQKID